MRSNAKAVGIHEPLAKFWSFGASLHSCIESLGLSLLLPLVLHACGDSGESARIQVGSLDISISDDGMITSFMDLDSGGACLPHDLPAPVLTLRSEGGASTAGSIQALTPAKRANLTNIPIQTSQTLWFSEAPARTMAPAMKNMAVKNQEL